MPLIYNIKEAIFRPTMVAFDYDWTIVNPCGGKTFPTTVDDWEWLSPTVPATIKNFYDLGHMIVIFTNQSKSWKCDQIKVVASQLNIPLFIVIANDKVEYKPNTIMFDKLFENNTVNKDGSLFVGDALGRKIDFADSDKIFADNIGIQVLPPERVFEMPNTLNLANIHAFPSQEIIIMVGFPGSGKSTISEHLCKNVNYVHISGDVYVTSTKMIKAAKEHVRKNKSIIFDATNSSTKKRSEYIEFAQKYNIPIRCIHVRTPLDMSFKYNRTRIDKNQVPKIAYSVYSKYFVQPSESEGFVLVCVN